MFKKVFFYLLLLNIIAIGFSSEEELKNWKKASLILQLWDQANVKKFESQIDQLKTTLANQKAPSVFRENFQKPNETPETYAKRAHIEILLCNIGFEGAMFLTASPMLLENFFSTADGDFKTPISLSRKDGRAFILRTFKNLEASVTKAQAGAALWFLSTLNTATDSWQLDFTNAFLGYCHKNGFNLFAQFVLHRGNHFFKGKSNLHERLKVWQGQCFAAAFLHDLEASRYSKLEQPKHFEIFKGYKPPQESVNALYKKFAELGKHDLMDKILGYTSWPKPSLESENYALQQLLKPSYYDRAIWMFTKKPGNKPSQDILDNHTAKTAKNGNWWQVDQLLKSVYGNNNGRYGTIIPVSKTLSDSLYVIAAARNKIEYLDLLVSESWGMQPSQEAKNGAFSHACMNNHQHIIERLAKNASSPGFDNGLIEVVKYRYQDLFDTLLDTYRDKLTESGFRQALEQAEKPSEAGNRNFSELVSLLLLASGDNHYQKRLKKLLGIPSAEELLREALYRKLNFAPPKFDLSEFLIPFKPLDSIDLSKHYIPIEEATTPEV